MNSDGQPTPKRRAIGTHPHTVNGKDCVHTLHTLNGTIVDVALADDGTPTDVAAAARKKVERAARKEAPTD